MKADLVQHNAIPLLVRCVMESKFDPVKIQQPALEILLGLSFHHDALSSLRENQTFMAHIRTVASKTTEDASNLSRAAEGLLWKLEKEVEAITKTNLVDTYQYRMMISYSHGDKQLCHRIHEQLVKDGFRVWIDRDQMHGATMIAMADAIENSQTILMCMSDAYKQSVYCQSEAHYAFERRRHIIPLVMKSHYKADGWLGIIASGKLYVDFAKLEFNAAYERLKSEINQHPSTQPTNKVKQEDQSNGHSTILTPVKEPSHTIQQYTIA